MVSIIYRYHETPATERYESTAGTHLGTPSSAAFYPLQTVRVGLESRVRCNSNSPKMTEGAGRVSCRSFPRVTKFLKPTICTSRDNKWPAGPARFRSPPAPACSGAPKFQGLLRLFASWIIHTTAGKLDQNEILAIVGNLKSCDIWSSQKISDAK